MENKYDSSKKYKSMIDHVGVKYIPKDWTGYENPYAEVTVKRGAMKEGDELVLKNCIAEALLRFGAITKYKFKAEIKQHNGE